METLQRDYYNAKDVQRITGASQNLAYTIIRKLRASFSKKYPDSISIQGKIPIWYFEEVMRNKSDNPENDVNDV